MQLTDLKPGSIVAARRNEDDLTPSGAVNHNKTGTITVTLVSPSPGNNAVAAMSDDAGLLVIADSTGRDLVRAEHAWKNGFGGSPGQVVWTIDAAKLELLDP
ncbi:MAG: hypothetical protein JO257_13000 [Deltaproteobacteria bacterium]|nr:hypothetical protein [Deltaproteobacteria bacterium]